ncbi:MAG: hypothetical protein ACLQT5_03000 [Steroidobacteraceae bacterium]
MDALKRGVVFWLAGVLALAGAAAAALDPAQGARVEARSSDLLAVGTVHGERMTIHLSRIADNAPVRDAVVRVTLRGTVHNTTAETDGSYSLQTPELSLPGAAAVQFDVALGAGHEQLDGTLQTAVQAVRPDANNNSRQLAWWVLNFAVCIGALILWRRRRTAAHKETGS